MRSIIEDIRKDIEYALSIKAYLDRLCSIHEDGFTAEYANNTYFFTYESDQMKIEIPVQFKEVYGYILRQGSVSRELVGKAVETYIRLQLREELLKTIL